MSKVIDAPAESSPAFDGQPEDGWAEYQAEKAKSAPTATPAKDDPESEPVNGAGTTPVEPKQEKVKKPLTAEEMSAMKRASNERRHAERERENAALKAENARLKAEKAIPAELAPAPAKKAVIPEDPSDPKPQQKDFTDFDEYVDARSEWNARRIIKQDRERQAQESSQAQFTTAAQTFMGKMADFAETHEGFMGTVDEPGAFQLVTDALEEDLPEVSAAIVDHEQNAELIDYLGKNPEVLERITKHAGNPARALIELGKIVAAQFDSDEAETDRAPVAPQKRKLPKPPANVGGRAVPTGEAMLDEMAKMEELPMDWRDKMRAREKR